MAVAFDAVGPSSAGASSTASNILSWTHTNVGSGVALFVAVAVGSSGDTGNTIAAKLDPAGANTTITPLGAIRHSNDGTLGFIALFGLPNVSSGAHTITATVTGGGTPLTMEGGSISYTGADTTTAFSAQQSAVADSATASVTFTGSTSGNRVAAAVATGTNVGSMSSGTSRWIDNFATSSAAGAAAGGDIAGGGSVTPTWSVTSDWWAVVAVEVLAAAGGGGGPTPVAVPTFFRPTQAGQLWR